MRLQEGGAAHPGPVEPYEDWLNGFAKHRLRVLYYVGFIANPFFAALDYLHGDTFYELLPFRMVLQVVFMVGPVVLRSECSPLTLRILLTTWILVPNISIAEMTVVLGGFTSQYYNGLNLVFLAAGVIVPISWRSHLVAQLGSLAYYFGVNSLRSTLTAGYLVPIENFLFLAWTCVCLQIAVILYERLQRREFEARQKLLDLDRLKSEFFANISHELRTPLTLNLGSLKRLGKLPVPAEGQELIQVGLRNGSRLLYLINELLELTRFDSGRAKLSKRCIDLPALVRGVAANFQSSKGRRVHFRGLNDQVPVEADPRQLKKVVYNLMSNAFKFSDREQGEVWIRLDVHGDHVQLEFEDNGIGIAPEQLEIIFDRFSQVETRATRRYEGSGIGLALVKELVNLHGGKIKVESKVGEGSTFIITLPRGAARLEDLTTLEDEDSVELPVSDEKDSERLPCPESVRASASDSPLVLVADDNADMRAYLRQLLGDHCTVSLAKDGLEALEQARKTRPELILTDVMMPHMSGHDLLKAVRADRDLASIPVMFLTARAGSEARVESLEAGADDYIQKPFDDLEVLARIRNLIQHRRTARKLAELEREKLAKFLPPHLSDMVRSGSAEEFLKGHRTEITVLFIDLRGFTSFAESAEPEDLINLLREYQGEMGRIIVEHQGTLERFTGDSLMVFFNDPVPVQDHQQQAANAAVAMRNRVRTLQHYWEKRGFDLGAGIGIATGFATIGLIGFDNRNDYAAIGTVTNLAARLCAEAKDGEILVPQRFLDQLGDRVMSGFVSQMSLKGLRNPISVHNIVGVKGCPLPIQSAPLP